MEEPTENKTVAEMLKMGYLQLINLAESVVEKGKRALEARKAKNTLESSIIECEEEITKLELQHLEACRAVPFVPADAYRAYNAQELKKRELKYYQERLEVMFNNGNSEG